MMTDSQTLRNSTLVQPHYLLTLTVTDSLTVQKVKQVLIHSILTLTMTDTLTALKSLSAVTQLTGTAFHLHWSLTLTSR